MKILVAYLAGCVMVIGLMWGITSIGQTRPGTAVLLYLAVLGVAILALHIANRAGEKKVRLRAQLQRLQDRHRAYLVGVSMVAIGLFMGLVAYLHLPASATSPAPVYWVAVGIFSSFMGLALGCFVYSFPPRPEEEDEY